MNIMVNGRAENASQGMTVSGLLEMYHFISEHVVVEINGNIIKKDQFSQTAIEPDDKIEILKFVGGG